METTDIIKGLSSLIQLDIDATQSYEAALGKIPEQELHTQLELFKKEHENHIDTLSDFVVRLGGTPPKRAPGIRGLFLEGMTLVEGLAGTEGALKGLQTGEKLTSKDYENALAKDYPPDIRSTIDLFFREERNHLQYVSFAIDVRVWENRKAA